MLCIVGVANSCRRSPDAAADSAAAHHAPDLSTPTKAAATYAWAINDGDIDTLHHCTVCDEADFAVVKFNSDAAQAAERFQKAAVKQFGDEGRLPDNYFIEATNFDHAVEKIDGDKATVSNEYIKNTFRNTSLKRDSDGWKVDLTGMAAAPENAQMLKMAKPMLDACDAATRDVEAGKFRTGAEAVHALRLSVSDAMRGP